MKINVDLNKNRGNRLKECRKNVLGMTQEKLAELSTYSVQHISMIENGRRGMSAEAAKTFGKILGVRKDYLLCESDAKTDEQLREMRFDAQDELNNTMLSLFNIFDINLYGFFFEDANGKRTDIKDGYPVFADEEALLKFGESLTPQKVGGYALIYDKQMEIPIDRIKKLYDDIYEYVEYKTSKFIAKQYDEEEALQKLLYLKNLAEES